MGEMRKVTINLPAELVEAALDVSGKGLTETIRDALAAQNHAWACQRLLELRGTVDLGAEYEELVGKHDREW
jgi:hypothetical protein